jgi:threonine/homoserine/homoserine lactone efflux protein
VNPTLLLAFWGATFLLIVVPGPDWAFILAAGARDPVVFPAVTGLMIGYAALTVFVAAGVGALVGHSPLFLTVLSVVGASYLIYLGISLLRHPGSLHARGSSDPDGPDTDRRPASASRAPTRSPVLRGIGVSGLNPKGLLMFVALLPQFADTNGTWPCQCS